MLMFYNGQPTNSTSVGKKMRCIIYSYSNIVLFQIVIDTNYNIRCTNGTSLGAVYTKVGAPIPVTLSRLSYFWMSRL